MQHTHTLSRDEIANIGFHHTAQDVIVQLAPGAGVIVRRVDQVFQRSTQRRERTLVIVAEEGLSVFVANHVSICDPITGSSYTLTFCSFLPSRIVQTLSVYWLVADRYSDTYC